MCPASATWCAEDHGDSAGLRAHRGRSLPSRRDLGRGRVEQPGHLVGRRRGDRVEEVRLGGLALPVRRRGARARGRARGDPGPIHDLEQAGPGDVVRGDPGQGGGRLLRGGRRHRPRAGAGLTRCAARGEDARQPAPLRRSAHRRRRGLGPRADRGRGHHRLAAVPDHPAGSGPALHPVAGPAVDPVARGSVAELPAGHRLGRPGLAAVAARQGQVRVADPPRPLVGPARGDPSPGAGRAAGPDGRRGPIRTRSRWLSGGGRPVG